MTFVPCMDIVFFGTPEFAVESLEKIVADGFNVKAVVTAPDKIAGRGLKIKESDVKKSALKLGIPILQPTNMKSIEFINQLKEINADLFVIIAFRMMPQAVWDMPPKGSINLHGSLLPKYRGAAPIHWAVINGEKETGCTTFFLKHEIDTGDIILQESISIGKNENTGSVYDRLMKMGAELMVKTLRQIDENNTRPKPQVILKDSPSAPKIFKQDCEINWDQDCQTIHNFIRGMSPFPTAFTYLNKKALKIQKAEMSETNVPFKALLIENKDTLLIGCKTGSISILELQLEGKKRMKVDDFLRGQQNLPQSL